jgi:hypothetical protein
MVRNYLLIKQIGHDEPTAIISDCIAYVEPESIDSANIGMKDGKVFHVTMTATKILEILVADHEWR